jgi:hypothetical protein
MTAFTLSRVAVLTSDEPCRTSETVDFETPAARAMSTTVTRSFAIQLLRRLIQSLIYLDRSKSVKCVLVLF